MVLEWLSNLGYRKGHELNAYLVGMNVDLARLIEKRIFLFGAGENGFLAKTVLLSKGIDIEGFIDNNSSLRGKEVDGKKIYSPDEVLDEDIYIIISVNEINIGAVRLQFMSKGIYNYSIFFRMNGHSFIYENEDLNKAINSGINLICFEDEDMRNAIPYNGFALGGDGARIGNVNWLIKSTEWSHPGYVWIDNLYDKNKQMKILEIGPGYGLMSYVVLDKYSNATMDWLLFASKTKEELDCNNPYEKGLIKVKNRFKDRVTYQFGMIEIDDDLISEKYDMIIMTEVFEHFVTNPIHTMERIKTYLNEDGKMLLTTPNWGHLPTYKTYRELPKICDISYDRYKELLELGHAYQYTKEEMFEILTKSGFSIEKYELSESNNHNFWLSVQ